MGTPVEPAESLSPPSPGWDFQLGDTTAAFERTLEDWRRDDNTRRLWSGDASLWTGGDEASWLGWLHAVENSHAELPSLERLAREVRSEALRHVVVIGMGGSSLCPDVLSRTFGTIDGSPELRVIDSTVPAQIRALANELDPVRTLFIVSSKSGTTIEASTLQRYFFAREERALGVQAPGQHFIAITDPGSELEELAASLGFRTVAHGVPEIGGRFSALSNFGLVPAACAGLDVRALLARADVMVRACARDVAPEANPGIALGLALGVMAQAGRDKLTFAISPGIAGLGMWLEQLIAESTGKCGRGIVPVANERLAAPATYGSDRLFAYLRLASAPSAEQDRAIDALRRAGHPMVQIDIADPLELGAEFFRWELATAAAGAVLGIHPFDQPDVDAAKVAARELMKAFDEHGSLPPDAPLFSADGLSYYADTNLEVPSGDACELLRAHLARLVPGDYFAIHAYVPMCAGTEGCLQEIRHTVRATTGAATCLGFGPRFLHSTGQLHKGGAANGLFLQITHEDAEALDIPGESFSFSILKRAQAQGDFDVLVDRKRRVLRVHLGSDVDAGLEKLEDCVRRACAKVELRR